MRSLCVTIYHLQSFTCEYCQVSDVNLSLLSLCHPTLSRVQVCQGWWHSAPKLDCWMAVGCPKKICHSSTSSPLPLSVADLSRRTVEKLEKEFLREKGAVSETQCDLGELPRFVSAACWNGCSAPCFVFVFTY